MSNYDVLKKLNPIDLGAEHDADLAIEGSHLDDVETEAEAELAEAFPNTATATLPDWERVCGIVTDTAKTTQQRRDAVVQRLRTVARLDVRYFIYLAATVGYTIQIERIPANDARYGGTEDTRWVWLVHVAQDQKEITYFTAGDSAAGDLLSDWVTEPILEDIINEFKPAHTEVYFSYPTTS